MECYRRNRWRGSVIQLPWRLMLIGRWRRNESQADRHVASPVPHRTLAFYFVQPLLSCTGFVLVCRKYKSGGMWFLDHILKIFSLFNAVKQSLLIFNSCVICWNFIHNFISAWWICLTQLHLLMIFYGLFVYGEHFSKWNFFSLRATHKI